MNEKNIFIFILLIFFIKISRTQISIKNIKHERTKIIWMVPSWNCKNDKSINVEKFGIIQNEEQRFINGSQFAIFYETAFGRFPYYSAFNASKPVNGGLPQLANLEEHLAIAEKDIIKTIPNENFDGVGVIDVEEFRPLWSISWGKFKVYKEKSIELVAQQHPDWPKFLIERQAKKDYERASRQFFIETLRLAKRLRPHAKWGFYLFPKCDSNFDDTSKSLCSEVFQGFNNELIWLWQESTALFPSIYVYEPHKNTPVWNFRVNGAQIMETERIRKQYAPNAEVHIFTKIEYDTTKYNTFYSKRNLISTIQLSMAMNVNSLIIWSSSWEMKNRCIGLRDYVETTLGPFVLAQNEKLDKCRYEVCNSNGECYLNTAIRHPQKTEFSCHCEDNYYGKNCEYRRQQYRKSMLQSNKLKLRDEGVDVNSQNSDGINSVDKNSSKGYEPVTFQNVYDLIFKRIPIDFRY